ncbi:MAG: hypothetical protein U0937_01275 [Thermodesulfovibrionia bacterium]|nr:hypothetical protein [Thermodesulfovibrionia bacterium]
MEGTLSTTGMSNPHPLTGSLLAAEFALLVLRVYYSARGEIGVPAVRFAGEKNGEWSLPEFEVTI